MVGREHARQLLGMQAGLNVNLGSGARLAEMKTRERLVYAQAGG